MKKTNLIILGIIALFFTSCEDVINVKVKQKEVKIVVDAFVNNMASNQVIKINRSIDYFADPNSQPAVTGAEVILVDTSSFKIFNFADSGNGRYVFIPNKTTGDTFTVGRNYLMAIRYQNDTFVSFSRMNPTAKIDSLKPIQENGSSLGQKGLYYEVIANDLVGLNNVYWIKSYRNDTFRGNINDLNIAYDQAQSANSNGDGGLFIWPIRYGQINNFNRPWLKGEKLTVEIHSLTLETYYYMQLIVQENQNGGLFATPPSAIPTNIVNANPNKKSALAGFFCMSAVSRIEQIVP